MGKRTRKKRNNDGKNNQLPKNNPNKAEKDDHTNPSTLLQRIRHADPRTRHAALAAVANTLLDTSRQTLPKASPTLLQAIRERVLDADLDVSQVAAGCLANYVTIAAALNQVEATQSMTAGWTLVLVGRLKQCYEHFMVQTKAENSNDNHPKKAPPTSIAKVKKQWLALAVQCLRTLCLLMETNPEAVGRLTSSMDASPRQDFHQTLLEWMLQGQQYYTAATKDEAFTPFFQEIIVLAARTLHSAWDDNADLLLPWKEECPEAFRSGMELLETIMKAQSTLPVVAQLHAMGAFLTARPFVSSQQAITITQQTVLPQLTHQLGQFSWTTALHLLQQYQQANEAWEKELEDDKLEQDVIRKVQERKEPARLIARRQKAQKDAAAAAAAAKQMEEEATTEAAAPKPDDAMEDDAEEQQKQQMETQAALEQSRDAWNQFLLPLQISLELLANLTSSGNIGEVPQDEEMMMDDDWGPDQEAQWIQEQRQSQQSQKQKSADEVGLQKLLLESTLPQQLKQLSQLVYQSPQGLPFPEQSRGDLEDLQSKTMACLGNCWENIPEWPAPVSWTELQEAATNATGMGKEGLVSAMVIALRTYPSVRKEWQPDHVTFWLNELSNSQNAPAVRRDIITMLGILCSQEPHPVEANHKICSALLATLANDASDSVMIPCEVLNVLMDMYGNDEDDGCCHGSVFESLQVLGHFQRSIPILKQKLKQHERNGVDLVEVEQWKETLLNGSRFVQYKKGQL